MDRTPPPPWKRNLVFGLVASTIVAGWVGDALWAGLIEEHPLVLIALNPKPRYMVLAVNELDPWGYYLVGTLRLMCTKPLVWLIGSWYGEPAVAWAERRLGRMGAVVRWVEQRFATVGWLGVAVLPNNVMCLLAGSAGLSLGWFLLLTATGTVARLWFVSQVGDIASGPIDSITSWVGDHRPLVLAVSITVVLASLWWQHRNGRSQLDELQALEDAAEAGFVDEPAPGTDSV